jgi:hypothetical protein
VVVEGDTEESHWRLVESRLSRIDDDDDSSSLTESLLLTHHQSHVTVSVRLQDQVAYLIF